MLTVIGTESYLYNLHHTTKEVLTAFKVFDWLFPKQARVNTLTLGQYLYIYIFILLYIL